MNFKPFRVMKGLLCSLLIGLFFFHPASAGEVKVKVIAVITGGQMIGHLKDPSGLFFDSRKKRLYISDGGNRRLLSFSIDSEVKFHAEFKNRAMGMPFGILKDGRGYFYTVDSETGKILFIDPARELVKPLEVDGIMPGRMAIDDKGRIYVVDRLKKRVIVIGPDGGIAREISLEGLGVSGITDIKVDGEERIYLLDTVERKVFVLNDRGDLLMDFGSKEMLFPTSIGISERGRIYVADGHGGRVLVFDKEGKFQYFFSRKGVMAGELYHPSYLVTDGKDRIFIIDGDRVQVFREVR